MFIKYEIDEDDSHKMSIVQCGISAYGITKEICFNNLNDIITHHMCELHQVLHTNLDKIRLSKITLEVNNHITFNDKTIELIENWVETHRRDKNNGK
jgi:hypothetical protein